MISNLQQEQASGAGLCGSMLVSPAGHVLLNSHIKHLRLKRYRNEDCHLSGK